MAKKKRTTDPFGSRWDKLATYNAERSRGIVHTPEWAERMAKLQAEFDKEITEEAQRQAESHATLRRRDIGLP